MSSTVNSERSETARDWETVLPTAVLSAGAEVNPHGSSFGDGLEGLNQGSTPLHLAAYLAREDVARILLSYGADRDAKVRNVGGRSGLWL